MDAKIVSATITFSGFRNGLGTIHYILSDGKESKMEYYADEISFQEFEVIGRTEQELYGLKRKKDVAYLRS